MNEYKVFYTAYGIVNVKAEDEQSAKEMANLRSNWDCFANPVIDRIEQIQEKKKWNVLMTTESYVEVEADSPRDAEMEALRMYQKCEIRPEYPMFTCEESDLIEE